MDIAALVFSIALAAVMLGSGVMKLIRAPRVVALMGDVDVTGLQVTALGVIDVAAAAGLVAGLWWAPLGVAAAVGTVAYFAGAIVAHLRAGDRAVQGAAVFLGLAVVTAVVLVLALFSA